MKIGFGLLPPAEILDYVRKLELLLSRKYHTYQGLRQPPHVTVKWPFETENLQEFEKYCDQLAAKTTPITIFYDGFGAFDPNVLFIRSVSTRPLVALHLEILEDLAKRGIEKTVFEGRGQTFHTTIAHGDLIRPAFIAAKKEIETWEKPNQSFEATSIGLFLNTGNEWIVHKEYSLKGNK